VVWGSTFAAIQVAERAVPPLLMAGVRFLLAGAILYAVAWRGTGLRWRRPTWPQFYSSGVVGLFLLAANNGIICVIELSVHSGLAALIIATVPVWMALMGMARGSGKTPGMVGWIGILVGLLGVLVLASPTTAGHIALISVLALLVAAACWAFGSLYASGAPLPTNTFRAASIQMLVGGAALVLVALLTGETGHIHWGHVWGVSLLAFAWLVMGGSWLGYSCYVYALKTLPISTVASYAYVNPLVALALGFVILGQGLTIGSAVAAGLITVGVVLIVSGPYLGRRRSAAVVT
jgi:drug/metabolite transporter (DMT)-like permease